MLKIEDLYYTLDEKENCFSSDKIEKQFEEFCDEHLESRVEEKGIDYVSEEYEKISSIMLSIQKIAFENGFKTAISLIFDSRLK